MIDYEAVLGLAPRDSHVDGDELMMDALKSTKRKPKAQQSHNSSKREGVKHKRQLERARPDDVDPGSKKRRKNINAQPQHALQNSHVLHAMEVGQHGHDARHGSPAHNQKGKQAQPAVALKGTTRQSNSVQEQVSAGKAASSKPKGGPGAPHAAPPPQQRHPNQLASRAQKPPRQPTQEQEQQQQRHHAKAAPGKWPFPVDYNDHFETPLAACADLAPALDALAAALGKTRQTLVLYDPVSVFYECNPACNPQRESDAHVHASGA